MKAIVLILILVANRLVAQTDSLTIEGDVVWTVTNEPMEDVTVRLLDGNVRQVNTDSLGFFKFKTARHDKVVVRISALGHGTKDTIVELNNNSISNLKLKFATPCKFNAHKAQIDIKKGQSKLLMIGGLAPVVFEGQESFEDKIQSKILRLWMYWNPARLFERLQQDYC